MPKKGGSIKIDGICPARIIAKLLDGHVDVFDVKTHVGHEVGELRARHLTFKKQKGFADQMLEVSEEKLKLKEAENEFINETFQDLIKEENIDDETLNKISWEHLKNRLTNLDTTTIDTTTFKTFMSKLNTDLDKLLPNTSTKRKMEKQTYYPQTQKKQRKQ